MNSVAGEKVFHPSEIQMKIMAETTRLRWLLKHGGCISNSYVEG